ncbi:MAG TPA: sulfite exporter TauE/SafE family protein [Casimicrobiaceae bacterium]
MLEAGYVACGALVGLLVGITGVGGGSLMTPLLVMVFGFAPTTAVGTDLLYASATKAAGVAIHGRYGTVDWRVVGRLACGSLPCAAVTLLALAHWRDAPRTPHVLIVALALVIAATGGALLARRWLLARLHELAARRAPSFARAQPMLVVVAGGVLGFLVTLTSIGAGALGVVMLSALYPQRLTGSRLVGTDLAHAIPLTLVGGAGHLMLGNIDGRALWLLLLGSTPGVVVGSMLGIRMPERALRTILGGLLLIVGVRMLA